MRAALFALLMACAGIAFGQSQPQVEHMQAYRDRLALYLSMGQAPEQVVASMTRYFPWFGARFGAEVDRDGIVRYHVAIGHGIGMTFFAVINP